jgi:hypothetical protein
MQTDNWARGSNLMYYLIPLNDKICYFCIRRKRIELLLMINRSQIVNINEEI